MKNKKSQIFITALLLIFVVAPFALHAQQGLNQQITIQNPFNCGGSNSNGSGSCDLLTLLTTILTKIIMPVASLAAVLWVIWAGFKYVMAKGNPPEIQKAHQNLLWALIGVGVILGAAGISAVLQSTVTSFLK